MARRFRSRCFAGTRVANRSGSATIETVGLMFLLALVLTGTAAFLLHAGDGPGRELGQRVANRIACGPRAGGICRQHPLVPAYGWPVARALTRLAPPIETVGGLVPVDFRYCQRASCAVPVPGRPGLTTANRRATFFTEVVSLGTGRQRFTYWQYRPSQGWESRSVEVDRAVIEAASGTRVRLQDDPRLVPLEILPGRNHYRLPPGDEPPWRWRIRSRYPGNSA